MDSKVIFEIKYENEAGYDWNALITSFLDDPEVAIPHPDYPGAIRVLVPILYAPVRNQLTVLSPSFGKKAYFDAKVAAAALV